MGTSHHSADVLLTQHPQASARPSRKPPRSAGTISSASSPLKQAAGILEQKDPREVNRQGLAPAAQVTKHSPRSQAHTRERRPGVAFSSLSAAERGWSGRSAAAHVTDPAVLSKTPASAGFTPVSRLADGLRLIAVEQPSPKLSTRTRRHWRSPRRNSAIPSSGL